MEEDDGWIIFAESLAGWDESGVPCCVVTWLCRIPGQQAGPLVRQRCAHRNLDARSHLSWLCAAVRGCAAGGRPGQARPAGWMKVVWADRLPGTSV